MREPHRNDILELQSRTRNRSESVSAASFHEVKDYIKGMVYLGPREECSALALDVRVGAGAVGQEETGPDILEVADAAGVGGEAAECAVLPGDNHGGDACAEAFTATRANRPDRAERPTYGSCGSPTVMSGQLARKVIGLTTSGITVTHLRREHPDAFTLVNDVDVSFDSPFSHEHDTNRGARLFNQAVRALQTCQDTDIPRSVIMCAMSWNFTPRHIDALVDPGRLRGSRIPVPRPHHEPAQPVRPRPLLPP